MSAREFEEWKLFFELEPQEPERSDIRTAMLSSQLLAGLGVESGQREVRDLMLRFHTPEADPEEVETKLKTWLRNVEVTDPGKSKKSKRPPKKK